MAKPDTYSWQGGGTYCNGKCDKSPNYRLWYSPTFMNGDDECIASACREHYAEIKEEHKELNPIIKHG